MTSHIVPADVTPVDVETLRTGITAAVVATPVGQDATWTDGIVTVTAHGASRVYHAWPQPLAEVTLTTPDGHQTRAEDIASWDDLHARVVETGDAWTMVTGIELGHAKALHHQVEQAERRVTQLRAQRDAAIRGAVTAGVTKYRLAQVLGLSQPAIGKIAGA